MYDDMMSNLYTFQKYSDGDEPMDDVQINSDPVKQKANNIKKMRILTLFDKDSAIAKRQEEEYELLTKKEDEEMQGIESVDQIVDQIQEEIINE